MIRSVTPHCCMHACMCCEDLVCVGVERDRIVLSSVGLTPRPSHPARFIHPVVLAVIQACAATQRINFARAANGGPAFAQSVPECHVRALP